MGAGEKIISSIIQGFRPNPIGRKPFFFARLRSAIVGVNGSTESLLQKEIHQETVSPVSMSAGGMNSGMCGDVFCPAKPLEEVILSELSVVK